VSRPPAAITQADLRGFPLAEIAASLSAEAPLIRVGKLPEGGLAYLLALLPPPRGQAPRLVVTPDPASARRLARDLRFMLDGTSDAEGRAPDEGRFLASGAVLEIPVPDVSPYSGLSPDRRRSLGRLRALSMLAEPGLQPRPRWVVTAADNLTRRVLTPEDLKAQTLWLGPGELFDRDALARRLTGLGYTRVQVVEEPGCFAVHGGTLDVFSPLYSRPLRVELWDDEIENLRWFDPDGQRTLGAAELALVPPAREELTLPTHLALARERIVAASAELDLPSTRARQVLADLASGIYFFGVESLMPAFHQKLGTLLDYLPLAAHRVVVDPAAVRDRLVDQAERQAALYRQRAEASELCLAPEAHFLSSEHAIGDLERAGRIEIGGLRMGGRGPEPVVLGVHDHGELVRELRGGPGGNEPGLGPFVRRVHAWLRDGRRVGLVVASRGRAERVAQVLREHGFPLEVAPTPGLGLSGPGADALDPDRLRIVQGQLSGGFGAPAHKLVLVTDGEVFGERAQRRTRPHKRVGEGLLAAFQDLQVGDRVVHAEHGVGEYQELVKLTVGGVENDYLLIQYQGGDRLYLPVHRLDQIHRHVGGAKGQGPALDKLGGTTWRRTRKRVRKGVEKLARELLRLQARRKASAGIRFSPPDEYFREFEARFPFEETPDQASAVDAVLASMMKAECMDHLVCGDVGYGKTEVAMRAAFLAAESGRQVAVLCPTTVLAAQHLSTFRQRFEGFPVIIEGLSRLTPAAEARRVMQAASKGRLDILVGTHRLLNKEVAFRDLGLIVVDEEQRFGVKQKERLKELRAEVDVLTLTATPIPRTLNMALAGMKDISIIATAPVDRQSIRTFVSQFDGQVLRQAILQELSRGGQVFYVHNRVRSLPETLRRLQELVPEARIGVAHGQMPGNEVEKVMVKFVRQQVNVLLCTAIIESGLDIPQANTMIVENAHAFGLAQLYQLRGRIGRSKERAFAYLIVPPRRAMTEGAIQRLEALQQFTELGAGFQIASLDLELRGAGDLLGPDQSGNLQAVGFEMYTHMLEEAVADLQGEEHDAEVEPELKLTFTARIPEDYITETPLRLGFYKRLSRARTPDEVGELYEELVDRFGPAPDELVRLLRAMELKALARQRGLLKVELAGDRLRMDLGESPRVDPEGVLALLQQPRSLWRLSPEMVLSVPVPIEPDASLAAARQALLDLVPRAT